MSLLKRAQKTPSKNHPSGNVVLQNADAGETKLSPSTLMYEHYCTKLFPYSRMQRAPQGPLKLGDLHDEEFLIIVSLNI